MNRSLALANPRRTGRSFELRFAQLRDPQARVDVVEIHQAVQQRAIASHRARLSAPGERQIRTKPFGVSGPEAGNLAALAIEVATQFTGNVEHARASTVVAL